MAEDVFTGQVKEVLGRLRERGSAERREVAKTYFPTALTVYGTSVPDLRTIAREVLARIKKEPADRVLSFVQRLVETGTFEGRQAAYEMLARHRPAFDRLDTRSVERLGRGMDNWGSVDAFAVLVAGRAWRQGQVTDAAVRRWADSGDRWWRRAALVSTVPLNMKSRGGTGDTPRTLMVCEILAGDRDEMVAKALSWALRELLGSDRKAVADFLDRHGEELPARVRREVRKKMETGTKSGR